MEMGSREVSVFQAKLGLLQMPDEGALIGQVAFLAPELMELVFPLDALCLPDADGFIPVAAGQSQAIGAEGQAGVEGGIGKTLRRPAQVSQVSHVL